MDSVNINALEEIPKTNAELDAKITDLLARVGALLAYRHAEHRDDFVLYSYTLDVSTRVDESDKVLCETIRWNFKRIEPRKRSI